jgi:ankyrin repeat protein
MTAKGPKRSDEQSAALMALLRAIGAREEQKASYLLDASPGLALQAADIGATRQQATDYYFTVIGHYVYGGDTALHIAAAAYSLDLAQKLLAAGANVQAKNRRGAEPLHYAADGNPDAETWDCAVQAAMVACLIGAGADADVADKSGVGPLHRAVRTRCAGAVRALLAGGADARRKNGSGSTPLHLAVQDTGRGGSGSAASREQQRQIILLLLDHGAKPTDKDAGGKSVIRSAKTDWVLEILNRA